MEQRSPTLFFPSPLPLKSADTILEEHYYALKQAVLQLFNLELKIEQLQERLPLIKWRSCEKTPGAVSIYLLAPVKRAQEIHQQFQEMVSHWLIPEAPLQILSSKNSTFRLTSKKGPSYYFVDLLVLVENELHLKLLCANLPSLAEAIKYSTYPKEPLSMGEKSAKIFDYLLKLSRKYHQTKECQQDIFRSMQQFLFQLREDFDRANSFQQLARIIAAHYLFKKSYQLHSTVAPKKRYLYVKLLRKKLHFPCGVKKVLGVAIGLNTLGEYERLQQRHLISAFQRICKSNVINNSFYSYYDPDSNFLTLYIEFEKAEGFSQEELRHLREELCCELKNSIEQLLPTLFIPKNEEELYRTILHLSDELKFVHDLPQAAISFEEQRIATLKFEIILVRLLHQKSLPLEQLQLLLPLKVNYIPGKLAALGTLRKKYVKEANVFSLEIESQPFLRKNHSLDLVKARKYIVQLVESMVGNFRDFNGGFLLEQNRTLEAIKKEVGVEICQEHEFLLENLFYALSPTLWQALISPSLGKELFTLFLTLIESEATQSWALEKKITQEGLIAHYKTDSLQIKEILQRHLNERKKEAMNLVTAFVDHLGYYTCSILYLTEEEEECITLLQKLEDSLPKHKSPLRVHWGADRPKAVLVKMLFEGLMRLTPVGIEPGVAEKVLITDDKKRYTFTLRHSLWSNGLPLTAFDFEYAWGKNYQPNPLCDYSSFFSMIKKTTAFDAKTLVVELKYPDPYFLNSTAHWIYSPLCKELKQRHHGWDYQDGLPVVGNGPFTVHGWESNSCHVIKNRLYWDAASVPLEKIALTQEVCNSDWYGEPIERLPLTLKEIPPFEAKGHNLFLLQINCQKAPLHSPLIQRALGAAIDRKALIDQHFNPHLVPAVFPHDEPQKLFAEGLKELNLTRQQFPTLIFSHSDSEEQAIIAQEIGKGWEKILGIKVKYERLLAANYAEALANQKYMIGTVMRRNATTVEERGFIPLFLQKLCYYKNPNLHNVILSDDGQIDFRLAYEPIPIISAR